MSTPTWNCSFLSFSKKNYFKRFTFPSSKTFTQKKLLFSRYAAKSDWNKKLLRIKSAYFYSWGASSCTQESDERFQTEIKKKGKNQVEEHKQNCWAVAQKTKLKFAASEYLSQTSWKKTILQSLTLLSPLARSLPIRYNRGSPTRDRFTGEIDIIPLSIWLTVQSA